MLNLRIIDETPPEWLFAAADKIKGKRNMQAAYFHLIELGNRIQMKRGRV